MSYISIRSEHETVEPFHDDSLLKLTWQPTWQSGNGYPLSLTLSCYNALTFA